MFILNFHKLSDDELKTDTNFDIAYQTLLNSDKDLREGSLIGVAQKPLSLGYIYHVFMRHLDGTIVRAEVYLELFSLKATIKNVIEESFKTGLLPLSQQDQSIKKMIAVIEKQATKPTLKNDSYTIQSVQGKDFLFGKFFLISISQNNKNYVAYVYHDQSSEEVLMLNWGKENKSSGCATRSDGG